MIGTIRKHQTWLWAIIITLTIGSFVVFGPTNTKMGNALRSQKENYGMLAGEPISRTEFVTAEKEVLLNYFFKNQQWPDPNSVDVRRETYWRLMFIQKQKELGVHVSTEAAATLARRIIGTQPGALDQFTDQILKQGGLNAADFETFLRHELGIQELSMTAGVSGKLVTPQEAETTYRLEHRDVESTIVYFSASNYLSAVPVNPASLAQYYSNQVANYRIPEQVQVKYVKFNAANYNTQALATLTNLDQMVDGEVKHLGTNLFHGTKTAPESREAIKREVILETSLLQAQKAASAFAVQLDEAQPHVLATFAKVAATNGLAVMSTEPFDADYGPQDIKMPPAFAKRAFGLSADEPFSGTIKADDGIYVIALVDRKPSRSPELKEIEAKVTADFRYASAFQLAQQSALKFSGTLSNGIAAGKTFAFLCAQASLHSQALPPFSAATQRLSEDIEDRVGLPMLKRVAFNTPPGKASTAAAARDGAFILYVDRLLPVDETKLKAEMPAYLAQMRQIRQSEAFQEWFNFQVRKDPEFMQNIARLSENPELKSAARKTKS